jgi:hypothetical protein
VTTLDKAKVLKILVDSMKELNETLSNENLPTAGRFHFQGQRDAYQAMHSVLSGTHYDSEECDRAFEEGVTRGIQLTKG